MCCPCKGEILHLSTSDLRSLLFPSSTYNDQSGVIIKREFIQIDPQEQILLGQQNYCVRNLTLIYQ